MAQQLLAKAICPRTPHAVIHCYVADSDPFSCHLLADAIARDPGAVVVGTASDERTMLNDMRELHPDALFVDVRLSSDSRSAQASGGAELPWCVVLVGAMAADAASALTRDATDFVLKPCSRARIITALDRVRRRMDERAISAGARLAK